MTKYKVYLLSILLPLVCLLSMKAQNTVILEHSETLSFDERRMPDAQILRGDVRFRHDSALMFCDSAYFFDKTNSLHAFGHVRMEQGDSLFGFADKLFYDGNAKFVRFRDNVKMIHRATVLTTDSLNYDRQRNLAYYYTGGTIADSLNTLTSTWGQYHTPSSQATFRREVKLTHPKFLMLADTLGYNSKTKIADIFGPTKVDYAGETEIFSNRGWYNTFTEHSMLLDRSVIVQKGTQSLTGDTIFYDKVRGFGQVFHNMAMTDSAQKITLYGNYGEMYEVGRHGYTTDSALMVEWSDSLHFSYLHADTLYTENAPYIYRDSLVEKDSVYRQVRAFHNVRIYRDDMQAQCDSMTYNGLDSVITLYIDPICWSQENQLSADSVLIYLKNGTVDYLHGMGHAFAAKQEKDDLFGQMAGKEIYAYIQDGQLHRVELTGNAETIYYPIDESDSTYVGMNRTMSSYVKFYFVDKKIHHILFTAQTTGKLYPMDQIPPSEAELSGFFWAESERPHRPGDVFEHPVHIPRPGMAVKSAVSSATDKNAIKKKKKKKRNNEL